MKREKDGNYSIIKDYGNGIECEIKYENHIKVQEGWSLDGEEHRDNGLPACIEYYSNGNVKEEAWWIHGEENRDDVNLPICIEYFENGNKKEEVFIDREQRKRFKSLCKKCNESSFGFGLVYITFNESGKIVKVRVF